MKATKKTEKNINDLPQEDNIDKIRDILFGVQVRDFEQKFAKMEANVSKEFAKSQEETSKKLDSLEDMIKKEIGALAERLYVEQDSRNEAVKGLTEELKITSKTFEKEVSKINVQASDNDKTLRENIAAQSKSMTDEFRDKQNELLSSLEEKTKELQLNKVDRESFGEALTAIGKSLSGKSNSGKK